MRRTFITLIVIATVFLIGIGAVGELLTSPIRRQIGSPPPDLSATTVVIQYSNNQAVSGWFLPGKPGYASILLLHGVRSDRRQMLPRARFLNKLGYAILLIDLPAHGESSGNRITYGIHESEGVKAALSFLAKERPNEKNAVIGVSLGAASIVLSQANPSPNAIILESMFPTISEAISDRLSLYVGPLSNFFTPALKLQLPLRLGVSAEEIRPITKLPLLYTPLLIAAGTKDQRTTLAETKRIYGTANSPKELWVVEGAAHVDLHAYAPKEYEKRIPVFLAKHLNTPN